MRNFDRAMPLDGAFVDRVYLGGRLTHRFIGEECGAPSRSPELWIGADMETAAAPPQGMNRAALGGEWRALRDWIREAPEAMLGARHVARWGAQTALLVKMFDADERLTLQAHPTREVAARLLGTPFGKTEAWYVVATEPVGGEPPYVLAGFKEGVTRAMWEDGFRRRDAAGMAQMLHRLNVQPGDALFIGGGMPHALGTGCLVIEVQEPSDCTICFEQPAGGARPDFFYHRGLGFDRMFECCEYGGQSEAALRERVTRTPRAVGAAPAAPAPYTRSEVFSRHTTPSFFGMELLTARGDCPIETEGGFAVLIALSGAGTVRAAGGDTPLRAGGFCFLPAAARGAVLSPDAGETMRVAVCLPPVG